MARTERDLSMKFVGGGIVALMLAILAARTLHMNFLGAALIVVFGFLFVTVSSRLTGEIGSSSNPISGMTVATLLLTCLIFLLVGWTGGTYYVTALSVGGIVCIAASNAGATSQSLKTGFLLGATPSYQQLSILAGAAGTMLTIQGNAVRTGGRARSERIAAMPHWRRVQRKDTEIARAEVPRRRGCAQEVLCLVPTRCADWRQPQVPAG